MLSDKSDNYDKTNELIVNKIPHHQVVASLTYLATVTRLCLANAISAVSENLENPKISDWCAVKQIYKYLRRTVDFRLLYHAKCLFKELQVYSDADYAGIPKQDVQELE